MSAAIPTAETIPEGETTPPAATTAEAWSPAWTRPFRARDKARETRLLWVTLAGIAGGWLLALTLQMPALALLIGASIGAAFYVRLYSMFHEHAHGVFLDTRSLSGLVLRVLARALMVTDIQLWQKGHQRHHEEVGHFGVLLPGAIGIVSAEMYAGLSPAQQRLYRVSRHPAFLFVFGYITIFIAYFNLLPLASRSRRRWNGLLTLLWHGGTVWMVSALAGPLYGVALVILPAVVGAMLGVMVFYLQHIFLTLTIGCLPTAQWPSGHGPALHNFRRHAGFCGALAIKNITTYTILIRLCRSTAAPKPAQQTHVCRRENCCRSLGATFAVRWIVLSGMQPANVF